MLAMLINQRLTMFYLYFVLFCLFNYLFFLLLTIINDCFNNGLFAFVLLDTPMMCLTKVCRFMLDSGFLSLTKVCRFVRSIINGSNKSMLVC
jgi:hypothetical protein